MPLNAAIQRIQRLMDSTGFSQMGRAGVHRPIYPILSAQRESREGDTAKCVPYVHGTPPTHTLGLLGAPRRCHAPPQKRTSPFGNTTGSLTTAAASASAGRYIDFQTVDSDATGHLARRWHNQRRATASMLQGLQQVSGESPRSEQQQDNRSWRADDATLKAPTAR